MKKEQRIEIGTVASSKGKWVEVLIPRNQKCAGCNHCILARSEGMMAARAIDLVGAKKGDMVEIKSPSITQFAATSIIFALPLLLALLGYALAAIVAPPAVAGLVALASGLSPYVYVWFQPKRFQMHVTRIVRQGAE